MAINLDFGLVLLHQLLVDNGSGEAFKAMRMLILSLSACELMGQAAAVMHADTE